MKVDFDTRIEKDELYIDIEPFVEEILKELTLQQFATKDIIRDQINRDEQVAQFSGEAFELKDAEFVVVYTYAVNDKTYPII